MAAVLAFALGAAFGAALALHLVRASRRSDDELIGRRCTASADGDYAPAPRSASPRSASAALAAESSTSSE